MRGPLKCSLMMGQGTCHAHHLVVSIRITTDLKITIHKLPTNFWSIFTGVRKLTLSESVLSLREMCMKYAQLEVKLGEIDRARGIFSHGSQMSDPRTAKSYWKAWQEFEVRHGNEDTFREMLRIKRSVQAQFNTQVGVSSMYSLWEIPTT